MAEEDTSNIEGRMKVLEAGLSELSFRIRALEQRLDGRQAHVVPPPPIQTPKDESRFVPPAPPIQHPPPPRIDHLTAPGPGTSVSQQDAAALEYNLGAKVLPWAGAIVLLVAIGYLASVGIQRGWIGPMVQFVAALAVSFGFIGVGFWKREEREEFGKLLVGIGSCGVYLTLGAGHLHMDLYEAEALVSLFLLWSFVNLAYSYRIASKAFLTIGLIGGLAATLMPLDRQNYTLNVVLHMAIVVPALAIAARNKWHNAVIGVWAASAAALAPLLAEAAGGHPASGLKLAAIYASTLLVALAYAACERDSAFDPSLVFGPMQTVLAAGVAMAVMWDTPRLGSEKWLYTLLFGVAVSAVGAIPFERLHRERLWLSSILVVAVVLPFGVEGTAPCWLYLAFAAALSLASLRLRPTEAVTLAWTEMAFAFGFYLALSFQELPFHGETWFLAAAMGASILVGWAGYRASQYAEAFALSVASLLVALGSRLTWVSALGYADAERTLFMALLWIAGGSALVALSAKMKWISALAVGWGLLILSAINFVGVAETRAAPAGLEITTSLFALAGVAIAGALGEREAKERTATDSLMTVLLWVFATRFAVLVLGVRGAGLEDTWAVTVSWIALGASLLSAGFLSDRRGLRLWSFGVFGAVLGKVFLVDLSERIDPLMRVAILALLGLALMAGGYWYIKRREVAAPSEREREGMKG